MNPSECRALLHRAVIIASVTPEEHQKLGGIFTHHDELYRRMLAQDISRLIRLGKKRYLNSGIKLQPTVWVTWRLMRRPRPSARHSAAHR